MSTKPSQKWLDQYKNTLVPEMFVSIAYHSSKKSTQDSATASSSDQTDFSDVSYITEIDDDIGKKYVTGENNLWILDGSSLVTPVSFGSSDGRGYVSSSFMDSSSHPVVFFSFSTVQTNEIQGITIRWASAFSEFARSFLITVKNGSNTVLSKKVTDNQDVESFTELKVSGFDSISIEIIEWCISGRRARIERVEFGQKITFDKNDLLSYSHESKRDPISGQLSKESISFSINNSDQIWNPVNPEGVYGYLYERQELSVRYGMDIDGETEWINGGKFFLSGWNVSPNEISVSFEARDSLSFLMGTDYTGRKYGTLYEMCYDALELLHVSGISYYISDELKEYSTDITSDTSSYKNSDILQMAANAAGMALYQTRNGEIRIERIPYVVTSSSDVQEIHVINNYKYPEISYSSKVKNVSCAVGNETKFYPTDSSETGATQSVNNAMLTSSILSNSKNALTESYALLSNRRKATLEYRASPHNDAFDILRISHQFGYSSNLLVTDVKYTFTGAFKGTVEGYLIDSVSSITLDKFSASLEYGESVNVKATLLPATVDSSVIGWSTDNQDAVTLTVISSSAGTSVCNIRWNGKGTATVTASISGVSESLAVNCEQSAVSKIAEGASVYITHGGQKTEYVVAKHDYQSDLNGTGKTLLVSKEIDGTSVWNESGKDTYADSTIDKLLNGDYLNGFSSAIRSKITSTKIYYTPGYSVSKSISTISRRVFLLSISELSADSHTDYYGGGSGFNLEGSLLPCYKTLVKVPSSYNAQWTRSCIYNADFSGLPSSYNGKIAGVVDYYLSENDGSETEFVGSAPASKSIPFRAAFTIPSSMELKADGSLSEV